VSVGSSDVSVGVSDMSVGSSDVSVGVSICLLVQVMNALMFE